MTDTINTTNNTPSTRTRTGRRPAPRPEQLAAEATIAETTAAAKPALSPEAQERLEKERQKLAKEQRAAENRARRIAALENGEELPTATRGLPPVVKMNELGALARQLHRAYILARSDEATALMADAGIGGGDTASASYALKAARDVAIGRWNTQHTQRANAGAAENETLAPLGLVEHNGEWTLVEKKGAKESATE